MSLTETEVDPSVSVQWLDLRDAESPGVSYIRWVAEQAEQHDSSYIYPEALVIKGDTAESSESSARIIESLYHLYFDRIQSTDHTLPESSWTGTVHHIGGITEIPKAKALVFVGREGSHATTDLTVLIATESINEDLAKSGMPLQLPLPVRFYNRGEIPQE